MPNAAARLAAVIDEMLADLMRMNPVLATYMGIHTYDDQLGQHTPERYAAELEHLRRYRRRLDEIDAAGLALPDQVDQDLARDLLDDAIQAAEVDRLHLRRPDVFSEEAVGGCYLLVTRDFAPAEERAHSLLGRLRAVPRVLAQGRALLAEPGALFTRVAIAEVTGAVSFFSEMIPAFAATVPAMEQEVNDAARGAAAAMSDYLAFLQQDVLPRATGGFALGRERFDWKLRHLYKLPYDADSLRDRGEELVRETLAQMEDLARQIDGASTWRTIIQAVKQQHPGAAELVDVYRRVVDEARQFIVDKDLVQLPPGDQLKVVPTPPFMRPSMAYAAYSAPGPFEPVQEGIFYVTPIDQEAEEDAREEQLQGHNWPAIKVTVLHEAYPGHHTQCSWANQNPRKLRRLSFSSLFAEGWTLYCEQMMDEQGWLATPEEKLVRLKDQLWRACRVVLDAGLHAHGMPVDDAIRMLQETAALESMSARTEVVGYYCRQPTTPMSYLIGKQELLRLKADYEREQGAAFRLNRFHSDLLAHGSIPFAYVRKLMLGGRGRP